MEEILHLINEMSPYLLLGFLLAGLMHVFIPGGWYSRYLSAGNWRSVVYAALFGVPLPLCSCGVIPTAMSLRKEGASRGATVSFLIATPQTGIDSIIATYSLMGLPFAIVRPVVAMLTAVMGGVAVNHVGDTDEAVPASCEAPTCGCCDDDCHDESFGARLLEALKYAYVEMMGDIGKWLAVGLVVAGIITAFVPDAWFAVFKDNSVLSMLLVLCIAVPMYICATGSIPIAVALMMKGLTPGAGLVLLMAGPACNVASLLVVGRVLGRRTLVTYLASIIVGAVGFGLLIDHVLPREWFLQGLLMQDACCETAHTDWLSMGSTVLLVLLLVNALVRSHRHSHSHHDNHHSEVEGIVLRIEGMTCSHCGANAQRALQSVEGVTHVEVDHVAGTAHVSGTPDLAALLKALEEVGFKGSVS